jgi:hypothetical protein
MTKIYIENNLLDVSKNLSQQITYAIDDIRNIDSKATPFTKTIILPGTTKNNDLLGNIFEFNNSNDTSDEGLNVGYNFNAARIAQCRIEVDGMTMIKGTFRLLEIIIDGKNVEYECSILGELGGFVTALGASKLEDLDFSAYNHNFTDTNITNSWDNAGGSSYVYPLIDYGTYGLTSGNVEGGKANWKVGTFRPAFYLKQYLDKIFENAGYTYDAPLFDTAYFKRLIIPNNQKVLSAFSNLAFNANTTVETRSVVAQFLTLRVPFNSITTAGSFTANGSNDLFTYGGATFTANISADVYLTIKNFSGTISIYKNDVILTTNILPTLPTGIEGNIRVPLNVDGVTVSSGDYFYVGIYVTAFTSGAFFRTLLNGYFRFNSQVVSNVPINYGEFIPVNDTLPKGILQKDFFTSIIKLFNLYVDEDKFNDKHLIIKPYTDYYSNTIEDWNLKIDRSKPISLKPMSELNSRYYQFNYKDDSDYYNDLYKKRYNESYGSYIYDSAYQFAKETAKTEILFSPTVLVGYAGQDKVYSTIFKRTGSDTAPVEETTDSNIRLLQYKKISGVTSWKIRNAANTTDLATGTVYPYAGHLNDPDAPTNDINFGVPKQLFFALASGNLSANQFNIFYSPYMAEITNKDSRLLSCKIKLNDVEVFNLDFAKYYFIDGGLYRLTKLIDYTPEANDTTKAEFLKVINKVY